MRGFMFLTYKEIQNKKLMGDIIRTALPHVNVCDIQESFGKQGYTYLINGWLFIKFPLNEFTERGLKEEVKLLEALKKAAVIKVPETCFSCVTLPAGLLEAEPSKTATLSFVTYQKVEGDTLNVAEFNKIDTNVRLRIVHHLGKFAAALHTLPEEIARDISLPTETDFFKGLFDYLLPRENKVDKKLFEEMFLKEFFGVTDVKRVICHNDLHPGNICVDLKTGWLRGVIDFGNAVWGPRQMEWMPLTYNEKEIKEFNRGYTEVTGDECNVSALPPKNGTVLNSINFYGLYKRVQQMGRTR